MRRPRAWFAATSSGRLGSASGPTTWLCLEWLDADRMNAAKAAGSGRESARPVPEERSPRPKSPLMERRKAMRFLIARGSETPHLRLAALHAPHFGGAIESSPRAWRETNLHVFRWREWAGPTRARCLKIESERDREGSTRLLSCPDLFRASRLSEHNTQLIGITGTLASEATPSFRRLCPVMTSCEIARDVSTHSMSSPPKRGPITTERRDGEKAGPVS